MVALACNLALGETEARGSLFESSLGYIVWWGCGVGWGTKALPSNTTSLDDCFLNCNSFAKYQSDKCSWFLFWFSFYFILEMWEFLLGMLIGHKHVLFSPIESYSWCIIMSFYGNAIIHSLSGFIETSRRHNSQCPRKEFSKTTWRNSSSWYNKCSVCGIWCFQWLRQNHQQEEKWKSKYFRVFSLKSCMRWQSFTGQTLALVLVFTG